MFSEGQRLLEGAFRLDHSTSIADLGSLFVRHEDKPLNRLKRTLAEAYGVVWSFPSTHGTTGLNILALLSACRAGGRVLVGRDAHSSVTAAMIHGGFHPVYVVPPYDPGLGLSLGLTLEGVQAVLDREPVDCIVLTSPTYFGIVGELGDIIGLARARGIPVIVDGAHAPHFHFCDDLPPGAEDLGADCVTQSTHKVATALSQGSLLLINNERLIDPLYEHVNDLGLVSTSFSYPILASIELGVRQLVLDGDALWKEAIAQAEAFRWGCRRFEGVGCFGRERIGPSGFRDFDPTRVTLDLSHTGFTGFEIAAALHEVRVYPEMATLQHVLFLLTPGTMADDIEQVLRALEHVLRQRRRGRVEVPPPPPLPSIAVTPRAAKFAPKHASSLREAVGRVSGDTIATYPPGSPILAAGEVISKEAVEYLQYMKRHGAVLRGASDPTFETMKVLS
ncbi:MAG TPA: beta-eliminating lyase-related protein [Vicinamibacterales bacterium]|nr:beta-eliminating lyase-related protein [Vicinamibacterales bacterium]